MQKLIDGVWHTRDSIVEQYAGLVYQQANTLSKTDRSITEDLEQEGFYALILAFDRFDSKSGYKFMTLAHKYVRGWMLNYKRKLSPFSGVAAAKDAAIKINKAGAWLWEDNEISQVLNISISAINRARLYSVRQNTLSLDFVGEDDDPVYEIIGHEQDYTDIDISLYVPNLTKREQFILTNLRKGYNLREISDMLNITRSRVGQIYKKIKIRLPEGLEWQ